MIYTINNCIRAFGYTNFDKLIADMGSVDNLREYVRANGYADIAVAEDTELLLVDVNGKTWHTGCYGAQLGPEPEYLCFTSTGDSTVAMIQVDVPTDISKNKVIQYKLNDGQWQTWDLSAVTLSDGDKMYVKSDDDIPMSESMYIRKQFVMTGSIAVSGNIMSLVNFSDTLTDYAFYYLFNGCTSLTTAPVLPATTLTEHCYSAMFQRCKALTAAPELPATTLAPNCYEYMFKGCTSLVQTPELPATTISWSCYSSMFSGCTSLTTTPALPATKLIYGCYERMFEGCTSLTTVQELPAKELVDWCYNNMFEGCTNLNYVKALFTQLYNDKAPYNWLNNVSSTGTFIKSKDATWTNEQAGIPTGWTVQVEGGVTPEPEPQRDYLCFTSTGDSTVAMQQNGTPNTSANKVIQYKLNDGQWQTWDLTNVSLADGDKMYLKSDDEIPISGTYDIYKSFAMTGSIAASGNIMSLLNFSDTLTDYAFFKLFNNCTALTTAPKLPATTLKDSCYASMFNGCTSLTAAPELHATTLCTYCYNNIFSGCTSLTQAPELPQTTLEVGCYSFMFNNCTSLVNAPALPATTLKDSCYDGMFNSCTSLTTAPELPATDLTNYCYNQMFMQCSKLNYVKAMFTTDPTSGSYLNNWLNGVSETGTFVKNSAATYDNTALSIPSGWTVQTATPDK